MKDKDLLFGRNSLNPHYQAVYDKFYNAFMKMDRFVRLDFSKLGSDPNKIVSNIVDVITIIQSDHPEIFWLDMYNFRLFALRSSVIFKFSYMFSKKKTNEILAQTERLSNMFLRRCEGLDDYSFALLALEKMTQKITYNHTITKKYTDKTGTKKALRERSLLNSVYGAMIEGSTICLGYAGTFNYLMKKRGIPCITVRANGKNGEAGHAWNIVKLNGEWCHVDCTFSDYDSSIDRYIDKETDFGHFGLTDDQVYPYYNMDVPRKNILPKCTSKINNYLIRSNKVLSADTDELDIIQRIVSDVSENRYVKDRCHIQYLIDSPDIEKVRKVINNLSKLDLIRLMNVYSFQCNRNTKNETITHVAFKLYSHCNRSPVISFVVERSTIPNPFIANLSDEQLFKIRTSCEIAVRKNQPIPYQVPAPQKNEEDGFLV